MRPTTRLFFVLFLFLLPLPLTAAQASETMTMERATELLNGIQGEVVSVKAAEIPGFIQVGMKMQGQTVPLYIDQSGTYLFSGNVIDLQQRKNLTEEHFRALNPIDLSQIPLDDALTLGQADAAQQIIVFTDPDCPYCSKMHKVLLDAVKADTSLVFQIKVTPLKESSYQTAKTIICNSSMEQLEQAFAGKSLSVTECDSKALDDNLALARTLGIRGTPTLILPNGQMFPGYYPLEELLKLINDNKAQPSS